MFHFQSEKNWACPMSKNDNQLTYGRRRLLEVSNQFFYWTSFMNDPIRLYRICLNLFLPLWLLKKYAWRHLSTTPHKIEQKNLFLHFLYSWSPYDNWKSLSLNVTWEMNKTKLTQWKWNIWTCHVSAELLKHFFIVA